MPEVYDTLIIIPRSERQSLWDETHRTNSVPEILVSSPRQNVGNTGQTKHQGNQCLLRLRTSP